MGPTEVVPGSQIALQPIAGSLRATRPTTYDAEGVAELDLEAPHGDAGRLRDVLGDPVAVPLGIGDAMTMDTRILHRGDTSSGHVIRT